MSILISEQHRKQCELYHQLNPLWGTSEVLHLPKVLNFLEDFQAKEIIDYGCGNGSLSELDPNRTYRNYDPCVTKFSNRPAPAPLLVCLNVLEHIEPESVDAVLEDIANLTMGRCYIIISTVESKVCEEPYLSLHPYIWWANKLSNTFRIRKMEIEDTFVTLECTPLSLYEGYVS